MPEQALGPIVFRKGKRVYLRPIQKEDLPHFVRWMNDPEITGFLKMTLPQSEADEEKWFESISNRKDTNVILAICLVGTDELIGSMGLHKIDHMSGTAMTGSCIGRKDLWGQGYGTEAKMLLLEFAFNTLNLRKIGSAVYSVNPRSKRCLEKCGYREEGCRKKQHWRQGQYVDEFIMAVFREDFAPLWENFKRESLAVSGDGPYHT